MPNTKIPALDTEEVRRFDKRRGHSFHPPAGELAKVPALYETEDVPLADKTVWLHFFGGPYDAWVAELDPTTGWAFGYVRIAGVGYGEWGYINLADLATATHPVRVIGRGAEWKATGLPLERDCYWTPAPWGEVAATVGVDR